MDPANLDVKARLDRGSFLKRSVTKDALGIEIGPWLNPLCPKSEGYNILIADVFDKKTLEDRAIYQLHVPSGRAMHIEEVDFVGSISDLGDQVARIGLEGKVDYIISSHNFEHIPDPIRFLQACDRVLKPGGFISMALPDCRTGGDFFRPHTISADMMAAYWECRTKPSPAQILSHVALGAMHGGLVDQAMWRLDTDISAVRTLSSLSEGYRIADRQVRNENEPYFDAHCWVFTPASFELIVFELRSLGFINFKIDEIWSEDGWEFCAFITKAKGGESTKESENFAGDREKLLHRVAVETGRARRS